MLHVSWKLLDSGGGTIFGGEFKMPTLEEALESVKIDMLVAQERYGKPAKGVFITMSNKPRQRRQ